MRTITREHAPFRDLHRVGVLGVVGLLALAGCLAPAQEGEVGSVEEFGRLMEEAGAEPVEGSVEPGRTDGIEPDEALLDPAGSLDAANGSVEEPPPNEEVESPAPILEDPYILFGERIVVREDESGQTFVSKPFTLPPGRPEKIVRLLSALEPFPYRERPAVTPGQPTPPLDPDFVEYQILAGLDDEFFVDFTRFEVKPEKAQQLPVSDLMVVTATPRRLLDFEDFLDQFAGGGVPQIELEAKIIEFVETDSEDIGGAGSFAFGERNLVKRFLPNLPNFSSGSPLDSEDPFGTLYGVPLLRYPTQGVEALLELGAVQDGVTFDAILQAVEGWQNVKIDSQPYTVVRAGGVARIETLTEIPFLQFKTLDANGVFTTTTAYKKVGTSLWISPRLMGSNTLALDIRVEGSQRVGSAAIVASTAGTSEVPVIAYRTARTVVHLKPGQTLVIGGLTQTRDQEIVSQVPILGDIPLIGFLFRSTFTVKEKQTVLFSISPRIIQNSDLTDY